MKRERESDVTELRRTSRGLQLLERLQRGRDNFEVVRWPGAAPDDPDAQLAIVPLSRDELQFAYAAALVRMEAVGIPVTGLHAAEMHDETNTQILARALRVLGDNGRPTDEPLFASADELRAAIIDQNTLDTLTDVFVALARSSDPKPQDLPDDIVAQLWDLVKKKDVRRLSATSSRTLASFIIGTASPPAS